MEDRIRELAYSKWQTAGCPSGDGVNFWCEAEAELAEGGCTEDHHHTAACGGTKKKVAAAAPPSTKTETTSVKVAAKTSKGSR